ncbi:MAG: CHAT domain-containing protein [Nitrospirae bacterium]|nr:CHAT domain-containing protein [Nitrospirota bacterium]
MKNKRTRQTLEELLRNIDALQEEVNRYAKHVTVFFIDIKGSTTYYEKWGDPDGIQMVQKYEDTILPIIDKYEGKWKLLGDGTMAYFEHTESCVKASIEILKAFKEYNAGKKEQRQIHVRIGINCGKAFEKNNDVFGDVVNSASRIESSATVDTIFINSCVYEEIKNSDEIISRHAGEFKVKGKSEPLTLYRVVWDEETVSPGGVRGLNEEPEAYAEEHLLQLEFQLDGSAIKARSFEKQRRDEGTLKYIDEITISYSDVTGLSVSVTAILDKAIKNGKASKEILNELKEVGNKLYNLLVPEKTKDKIKKTSFNTMALNIDESLINIPWELLYDGNEFFCNRFNMGRVISTRRNFQAKYRKLEPPLRVLIVAEPTEKLPEVKKEADDIRDAISTYHNGIISVSSKEKDASIEYLKNSLPSYDMFHFAGHLVYKKDNVKDSGLTLIDGVFKAEHILEIKDRRLLPAFIFLNTCHSGQTENWAADEGFGSASSLAEAFLLSGVRHYLGTFWKVMDEEARNFATGFYKELVGGANIGEALRKARLNFIIKCGEDNVLWASYILYGDPTFRYFPKTGKASFAQEEAGSGKTEYAKPPVGGEADTVKPNRTFIYISILAVIITLVTVLLLRGTPQRIIVEHVQPQTAQNVVNEQKDKERDKERDKEIDALVDELARKFKENKEIFDKPADEWTSRPISVAFIDVKPSGLTEMENNQIITAVNTELLSSSRVKPVNRVIQDKLFRELKLDSSGLANKETAQRLGNILSAKLIVTGNIAKEKNKWVIIMNVTETETTAIKGAISYGPKNTLLLNAGKEVGKDLLAKIIDAYPIQARITEYRDGQAVLNVGTREGIKKDMLFDILSPKQNDVIGKAVIVSVTEKNSVAEVTFKKGRKTTGKITTNGITRGTKVREAK